MSKSNKKEALVPGRKVQLSFTLQKSVNDRFLSYCKDNMINKSQMLEHIIIAYFDTKDFAGMVRKE